MDDEDYVVTNLDDGEKYSVGTAAQKFNVLTLSDIPEDSKAQAKITEYEEDEDYYFDAEQSSNSSAQAKTENKTYVPLSIPSGGRIEFHKIAAVGTARDSENKAYSVFYLDVRCNISMPNSWYVYRRYSQFRKLSDVLRSEGYYVPVLPPKRLLGSLTVDFVKSRKVELETWLRGLEDQHLSHPGSKDPQKNASYRQFLTDGANCPPHPLQRVYPEHMDISESKSPDSKTNKQVGKAMSNEIRVSLEDFELVRVIGKGSFGKVSLVKKVKDNKFFAMKVLTKTNIIKRKQVEHTRTERRILGSINHPFIVKLHYAFQTDKKLYFVLDYAAGGELFYHLSRMKKFPEHMTRFYAAEIALALDALHCSDVVYRDLKPENILLDADGHIKLADFGLAKEGVHEPAEGAHSLCGTPEYLSPEVLDRNGHGTAVDWWNLGMVTYEMLTGLPPWYTTDKDKLFDRLRNAPLKFPYYVSRNAALLISALLNRNPLDRLGSNGGVEVKTHPFFSPIDWNDLYNRKIQPPFNPCKDQNILNTDNFDAEFTSMPLQSVEDGNNMNGANNQAFSMEENDKNTFLNFTFEEESYINNLRDNFRDSFRASRDGIRK